MNMQCRAMRVSPGHGKVMCITVPYISPVVMKQVQGVGMPHPHTCTALDMRTGRVCTCG